MDVCMTIQTGAREHAVSSSKITTAAEGFKPGVNRSRVARGIVTALAEERRLGGQELPVIAAVGRMTCQAVLFHGRMLPQERSSFFSMTLVAKLIHIIRLDHFRPESAMLIMALGALHESFFQWVMGLPVLLRADISVAGIAEHGLLCLQVRFQPRMGIVAIVTGNAVDFVPAHIPERYCP